MRYKGLDINLLVALDVLFGVKGANGSKPRPIGACAGLPKLQRWNWVAKAFA